MSSGSGEQARRVVVVGGGVTGLAAAHRLVELSRERGVALDIHLHESGSRLGGTIITSRREGFLIEGGPDSFITQKPWGLALVKRIGLDDELIETNPACRRTFVVRDGRMHAVPEGFLLLAPTRIMPFAMSRLFSWRGKLRMAMDLVLPRGACSHEGDESLSSFVRRRFGREALERVAQPLVGGIYTADPENLSLRATMPRFLEMEAAHRSIILAMRKGRKAMSGAGARDSGARYSLFVSLRGGMSTLIDELARRLPAGSVHLGSRVALLEPRGAADCAGRRGWRLQLADGAVETADGVILACPAHASFELLNPLDRAIAEEFSDIPYSPSATMTMAFRTEQVRRLVDGFGFVVPAMESRSLIAVTFSSVKFPGRAPDGWVLMRGFLGGSMNRHVYALPDDELRRAVLRDLRDLVGVEGEPAFIELYRWPASMPQYPVGHLDRVRRIEEGLGRWHGLLVAGNAFGGVGVPDCVHSAETAADRMMSTLLPSPPPHGS